MLRIKAEITDFNAYGAIGFEHHFAAVGQAANHFKGLFKSHHESGRRTG